MSMKMHLIVLPLLFLMAAGLVAFPASVSSASRGTTFAVHLSAAPGVVTRSTGEAIFHLSSDGTTLSYKLIVANTHNVFMAHIHFRDGSIIIWLYPNPNVVTASGQAGCIGILSGGNPALCPGFISGRFSGILARGTLTAANLAASDCAGCNGFTFSQLISAMESGSAFVNVHTLANPGGELQGFF